MLGNMCMVVWIIVVASYFLATKFRYDDIIAHYVNMQMSHPNSSFLSSLLNLFS